MSEARSERPADETNRPVDRLGCELAESTGSTSELFFADA